ncbi:MAG: hypothetical protein K2O41_01610, partial [Clostridia bacterium]|nr:hypothetical protein [Clostridia bacterium]
MKCLIVVNAYIKNKSQIMQAERIAVELKLLGAECEICKNVALAEIVNGNIVAPEYDCCVFLDKDKAAARLLEKSGIRLFNSAAAVEVCDDKMLTHIALANCGVPMPDSIYAPLCYYADAKILHEFLNKVETLGYPLVAKTCYGSLGGGVFLVGNRAELEDFEAKYKTIAHFYQRFTGKGGEDIRAIVIGGENLFALCAEETKT